MIKLDIKGGQYSYLQNPQRGKNMVLLPSLSRPCYTVIKRPCHPLASTGELCVNYYPGLSSLAEVSLMTGLEQFVSGQAITQCHQVRIGCHIPTPSQSRLSVRILQLSILWVYLRIKLVAICKTELCLLILGLFVYNESFFLALIGFELEILLP